MMREGSETKLIALSLLFFGIIGLSMQQVYSQSVSDMNSLNVNQLEQLPAFPGAWGGGMYATGGRGGKVLMVTNLNDSGPGSLRAAVEAEGPRIVVFKVSGTIELESELYVDNPNITIAGQTAPGGGIALKDGKLHVRADNTIVRYIRVRRGDENTNEDDGIAISEAENVIVDHCTVSWTTDEAINTWHGTKNATYQWCLIAESLNNSVHYKGEHGYGASLGGENTTYHHNLLAHHTARNPSIAGNDEERTKKLDWRNNLVYNWEYRTLDGKPDGINVINNYYKPGPVTTLTNRLVRIDSRSAYDLPPGRWYISGNIMEGQGTQAQSNWQSLVELDGEVTMDQARVNQPLDVAPVPTQPAREIVDPILKYAGTTVPRRDQWENRIVSEVRTGTARYGGKGIIDSQSEVGGWPELHTAEPAVDSDSDGMPDWWEVKYGLDPQDATDATGDLNGSGYTNIEEYINGTNPTAEVDYTDPANNSNPLHQNPRLLLPH